MRTGAHASFATTSSGGLRHDSPPMRLYQQAKRAAGWDPRALDFSADARHWARLTEVEQDLLLRLTALFQAGEEGMTLDAAPWLAPLARERRHHHPVSPGARFLALPGIRGASERL